MGSQPDAESSPKNLGISGILDSFGVSRRQYLRSAHEQVVLVVGEVRVERPNGTTDIVRKDHAYPFGSRLIIPTQISEEEAKAAAAEGAKPEDPQVFVRLARDFTFRLGAGSDVRILDETTGDGDEIQELKVFDLAEGTIDTRISAAVKNQLS